MTAPVTMRQALSDPALLGGRLEGDSWLGWRALLIASMGEPLEPEEREAFTKLTGRLQEPLRRVDEARVAAGRRAGKSVAAATLVVYLALLWRHGAKLQPGERPTVLCLAPSQDQATIVFSYITGIVETTPLFAGMVRSKSADAIEFENGVVVQIRSSNYRRVRGATAIAIIIDEVAFLYDADSGSANSDEQILAALRPALLTTGGPLIAISSPYSQRGVLYDTHKRHFGPDGDPSILVASGASWDFNTILSEKKLQRDIDRDPEAAVSEYYGNFRTDISAFLSRQAVESCVTRGVATRAPLSGVAYVAAVDPSGGASDSMTLAIAHNENGRVIVDCVLERRPPFSPESVTKEFADVVKSYRISAVRGDRYAGEWPRERFQTHGVAYWPAELNRSEAYLAFVPLVSSGRVDLVDNPRLVNQFAALERRTGLNGKDSVDHKRGQHEDLANAVALAAVLASTPVPTMPIIMPIIISKAEARSSVPDSPFYVSGDMTAAYRDKRQQGFSRRAVF